MVQPVYITEDGRDHIVINCLETERLSWQLLPKRFFMSERGRLAYGEIDLGWSENRNCVLSIW